MELIKEIWKAFETLLMEEMLPLLGLCALLWMFAYMLAGE